MSRRRRFVSLGLAAAFAVAGGTAWAVAQAGDFESGQLSRPTGMLAQGVAPSGEGYELSRIDPADRGMDAADAVCTQIRTPAAAAQGCDPVPDADGRIHGHTWRPSLSILGSDRFFTAIAPKGVTAMAVQVEGQAKAATSRSIDAGPAGTLLIVAVGGRVVTSRDPASSLDYVVRLLDANGETVNEVAMSDSGRE
jgi:hypothetical protein